MPSARLYLTALLVRLSMTLPSSSGSAVTSTGSSGIVEGHLDAALLGLHRHQVEARLGELAQVDGQAHGLALVLDLGVVEQVLHQPVEPLGVARDRLDRADAGVEVLEQLDVADDRGQRRLELVGDGRDQLALVAVELLELADQVALALVEPGVEDDPAERAADLHHGFLLLGGPGADGGVAGQQHVAEQLAAHGDGSEHQAAARVVADQLPDQLALGAR